MEARRLFAATPHLQLGSITPTSVELAISCDETGARLILSKQIPFDLNFHDIGSYTSNTVVVDTSVRPELLYNYKLRSEKNGSVITTAAQAQTPPVAVTPDSSDPTVLPPDIGESQTSFPGWAAFNISSSMENENLTLESQFRWENVPSFMGTPEWGVMDPSGFDTYSSWSTPYPGSYDVPFGMMPGYEYSVRAVQVVYDENYNPHVSPYTQTFTALNDSPLVINRVTDLMASAASDGGADLSWTAPSTPHGVDQYVVAGGDGVGNTFRITIDGANTSTHVLPSYLTPHNWSFTIFAIGQTDDGAMISPVGNIANTTVTGGVPVGPSDMTIEPWSTGSRLFLYWHDNADNELGYTLSISTDQTTWVTASFSADRTSYGLMVPGLIWGKQYWFRLSCYNATGTSTVLLATRSFA